MFVTRLISGIILLAVTIGVTALGGPVLFFFVLAVSLIGMYEFYRAADVIGKGFPVLAGCGYLAAAAYYALVYFDCSSWELPVLAFFLNLLMAVYVLKWPEYHCRQVFGAFFGIVYTAVMLSFIYRIRCMPAGRYTVWLIFICSWGCDTCAYCVGMLLGKHKMAPVLSPKKSVEGAVGGIAGAMILGAVYAAVLGKTGHLSGILNAPVWKFAVICAAGAVISMFGDLAASGIKRNVNIKDYGKLIPGHGGILDRFDSVIFTAPVIWILLEMLSG